VVVANALSSRAIDDRLTRWPTFFSAPCMRDCTPEPRIAMWLDLGEAAHEQARPVRAVGRGRTMLTTFRVPGSWFAAVTDRLRISDIHLIHLGLNRGDARPIVFDDLEIVKS
jgi:hypothetical protein